VNFDCDAAEQDPSWARPVRRDLNAKENHLMRHITSSILLTLTALWLGGCVIYSGHTATKTMSQTTEHFPGAALVVDTQNGSIQIIADSSVKDVQIDATIRCGGETQAEAEQHLTESSLSVARDTSRRLTIRPVLPPDDRGRHGASFVIRLPDADGVTATTSNGRIVVTGLSGELIADTSNGSVVIADHDGPVHIDTSNGHVSAERVSGALTVDTSNGSVTATDVSGPVRIGTSNGSITMKLGPSQPGPLHLDTSNGSVSATVGAAFAGVVKLDTSNGGITVKDSKGRITSQSIDKSDGVLTIGSGGETSIIDTSNGRIEFVIVE
jgi:hypothetical protein